MDKKYNTSVISPDHIEKVAGSDYEKNLKSIIVTDRKFDEPQFDHRRKQYRDSMSLSKVIENTLPSFPGTVNVELVNKCNYKCEMCYTVNHMGDAVHLELEDIYRIIDECANNGLMTFFIGNGSEPTIYPQLLEVVEYACNRLPDVALFTNGSRLTKQLSSKLINLGISRINISLDAATLQTYLKIRKKTNLKTVEQNIHDLVDLKNKYGRPLVRVSFCKQPDNKHETSAFLNKWRNVVDSVEIQNLHIYENLNSLEVINDFNDCDIIDNDMYCYSPFSYLAIWSNGDISPCCTFHGQKLILGNVNECTLKETWESKYMTNLRNQFINKQLNNVCNDCLCKTKCY